MALLEFDERVGTVPTDRLSVAVCGTFHRDRDGLRGAVVELRERFHVLSPASLDFVDANAPFVRLPSELADTENQIERRHLQAMREADLIWLHAPGGYVGTSGAMELGHATALGIPVFAATLPSDPALAASVVQVSTPRDVDLATLEAVGLPGSGLDRLQRYYRRTAERRGWSAESPKDTLLLLTEELGELARAVRKLEGLERHHAEAGLHDAAAELADVQLYVVHLANALGLELADAVTLKERVNSRRFGQSRDAAA